MPSLTGASRPSGHSASARHSGPTGLLAVPESTRNSFPPSSRAGPSARSALPLSAEHGLVSRQVCPFLSLPLSCPQPPLLFFSWRFRHLYYHSIYYLLYFLCPCWDVSSLGAGTLLGPQPLLPQGLAPRKSLLNMCGVMNSAWQPDKAGRRPSSSPPGPDPIESIFPSLLSIRSPWPTHHWSGQSQWPGLKETGRSEGVKWPGWGMEGGGDAESQNQRPAHWRRWEWAVHGMAEKLP